MIPGLTGIVAARPSESFLGLDPADFSAGSKARVVFYGDSLTEGQGEGAYRTSLEGYFADALVGLSGKYETFGYRSTGGGPGRHQGAGAGEFGVGYLEELWHGGGTSATDLGPDWTGTGSTGLVGAAQTLKYGYPYDICFVLGGINNYAVPGQNSNDAAAAFALLSSKLDQMFARYPAGVIVVASSPKTSAELLVQDAVNQAFRALVAADVAARQALGQRIFYADTYGHTAALQAQDGNLSSTGDGIHPNARGYRAMGQAFLLSGAILVTDQAPAFNSSAAAAGTVGQPYSHTFTASGTPPFRWEVSAGTLPAGLTLDRFTGVLSGTPTTEATSAFTVRVLGYSQSATQAQSVAITVDPLTTGLAASWPMSESSGNALDVSGNARHMVQSGSVNAGSGATAGSRGGNFDTSNLFSVTNSALQNLNDGDFSVGFWAYVTNNSATRYWLGDLFGPFAVYFHAPNGQSGVHFLVNTGFAAGGTAIAPSAGLVTTGAWHFFLGTYTFATKALTFQMDGGTIGTATLTGTESSDSGPLVLGCPAGFGNPMPGHLKKVKLYSRAVDHAVEGVSLYAAGDDSAAP